MTSRMLGTGPWQRFICAVLAVTMTIGPSLNVLAQSPATQPQAAAQPAGPAAGTIDTTYVSPGAAAVVVLRPAQIMKSPLGEFLPTEVATAAGLKYLGVDPANVERVIAFLDLSNPTAPSYGLTLKLVNPIRSSDIPEQLRAHTQPDKLAGKSYLKSQQPALPSFYAPDNHTIVVVTDAALRRFVESPQAAKSGPIIDRVMKTPEGSDLYLAVSVTMLRPLVQMGLAQSRTQIPPDAQPLMDALNLLDTAELTLNITKAGTSSLVANANDEAAAKQIESILTDLTTKYQEKMKAGVARQKASEDPVERAMAQYTERVSGRWSKPIMPVREGSQLTFFHVEGNASPQQQMISAAAIGVLVALLLPATQAAREAARRSASMNSMKQLMLALLNYESAKKTFPANANYSGDKPLLSWRVLILPFLEEQELYSQFHLNEPWDSEHNRALIARMPEVYKCPSAVLEPGKTCYLGVAGKGCMFEGDKGIKIRDVTDGTSKTIMLVEANADQAVEWTKPDDWKFDPTNPKAGLGGLRTGGWNAAFCDGSIQFISNNFPVETLKAYFTRNGGEVIGNQ